MMQCKYCGSGDLEIIYKLLAKEIGEFSLSGQAMKFSVVSWPYMVCHGGKHESKGKYS